MKKAILTVSLLLIVALAAAGCGQSGNEGQKPDASQTAPAQEVTLKFFNSKTEIVEQLNELKKDYEQSHPGIKLQIDTVIGTDYGTALKARFAGDEMPDIFVNTGDTDFSTWIDRLEDLTDQPWVKDVVDSAKPPISKDGKLYGMPMSLEGFGFIYNKDLFAEAGIKELPHTFTELQAVVEQLKSHGITPFVTSYQSWVIPGRYEIDNAFGKQPDPDKFIQGLNDGTEKIKGNPLFEDFLNLADLQLKNSYENPLTIDYNTQVTHFANGKAAMILNGNWTQILFDDLNPNLNMGIMPMPLNDDAALNDNIFVGVPMYYVVNKESKLKQEAKDFLNWLATSDAGKSYITEKFKFIPPFSSFEADPNVIGPLSTDVQQYIKDGKVLSRTWQKYPTGANKELGIAMQKYASGASSRDQALDDLQTAWDKMVVK